MVDRLCDIGVLFADISDSTRLYRLLGDEAALHAIEQCLTTMADVAKSYGGNVVKSIGDELMVAFPEPIATFDAAIGIQLAVSQLSALPSPAGDIKLELHVGFHFGPAIVAGDDVFGDTVIVAARLTRIARAGQIITSSEMIGRLSPAQLRATRALAAFAVKGRPQQMRILEVIWQAGPNVTVIDALEAASATAHRPVLQLGYEGTELVSDWSEEIAIGRGPGNDLTVPHYRVSRRHATISFRHDNWVLCDHSTNGSYVTFMGEPEIPLHHGELVLHKSGVIALGLPSERQGVSVWFALLRPEARPTKLVSEQNS